MSVTAICVDEAAKIAARSDVVVIDVRPPFSFCGGRIPGSINMPGMAITLTGGAIPSSATIIFVDDEGGEAERPAQAASAMGFSTIHTLEGGYEAWLASDLPIETISDD